MVDAAKEINPHFKPFLFDWDSKIYFLVGGYGSSKSYHVALKVILKLLSEKRTALVVREVYDTIRDSCFSLFREIVEDMELRAFIQFNASPMQMRLCKRQQDRVQGDGQTRKTQVYQ